MAGSDRITREVTPFVEVVQGVQPVRARVLLHTEVGAIHDDDGRAIYTIPSPLGHPTRVLLDPDADLYELVLGTDRELLRERFEVHLPALPRGPVPRELRGRTLVLKNPAGSLPHLPDACFAAEIPEGHSFVPKTGVAEVHVVLSGSEELPTVWPETQAPVVAVLDLSHPDATEVLPQLMHAMGSGRCPVRELRLRVDPQVFQSRGLRAPFMSEVVEAIASGSGCTTTQLARELALRQRMVPRGLCRHLLPDPYFSTWTFRGHRTRGLVPATDHFPVPQRASRREIMRGTPESEHERLIAYLSLLGDSSPRAQALQDRHLFAVSLHFLPNPDVPLYPNHGGIGVWNGIELTPLGR